MITKMSDDFVIIPMGGHFIHLDLDDVDRVMEHNWCNQGTYVQSATAPGSTLHRFLLNAPEKIQVDHINGDPWDCRKQNLRLSTQSENMQNQKKRKGQYSSIYKGVSLAIRPNKTYWKAGIYVSGKSMSLGYFSDEVEAAKAYDAAARLYFGEFARPNFNA